MPISAAQAYQNKVNNLAVKDSAGNIIDYSNPYASGTESAKFFDSLSFEGKKTLLGNQYAFEALTFPVEAKGAEWAKDNILTLLRITPPTNTDPYAEAKKYYTTEGSFGDFLVSVAPTLLGVYAPELTSSLGNYVSNAVGGGVVGDIAAGAVTGAAKSALTGGDIASGALTGGVTSGISSVTPDLKEAVGGGVTGNVVTGALTGGVTSALKGGDIGTGIVTGALKGATTSTPNQALDYSYADDAAQLAEQGLGSSQIADILGVANAPVDVANNLADYAVNAVSSGLKGADVTNYINNQFTADAQFSAADASQLFDQGLSNQQVQDVLTATDQGNTLTNLGMDAEFIAADAQQLWDQTKNVASVEQNLVYAGIDPIVAASLANEVAMGTPKDKLTDVILNASDFNALTTDGTLFSESPVIDTSGDFTTTKTQQSPQQPQAPVRTTAQPTTTTTNMTQQPQDDGFFIPFGRTGLENPFARSAKERQSLVGSIFGF